MRSVVVVLPASMWAMMPMLRVFSSEYCRSTSSSAFCPVEAKRGVGASPPSSGVAPLPAVMRERLVGLRHLVRVLSFLHRHAAVVGGVEQLGRQLVGHAALGAPAGRADHPAHGERGPAVGGHLDR